MNRRRALVALLVSAATVAGFAGPAGAAVPKTPADFVLPCRVGSGKSAQLWTVHHFTAKKQDAAHPVVSRSALGQKSSAVLTKV